MFIGSFYFIFCICLIFKECTILLLQVAEIANKYNSTCDALRQPPHTAPEDRMTVRQRKEAELQAAWETLHQYWQFVQDNPYDFNGWTYLLSHVETMVGYKECWRLL